ncbi:hypothetical protein RFI_24182, partial [Reticulomyxa filosa]
MIASSVFFFFASRKKDRKRIGCHRRVHILQHIVGQIFFDKPSTRVAVAPFFFVELFANINTKLFVCFPQIITKLNLKREKKNLIMFNEDTHREFQRGIDPQAGKTKRHEDRLNLRREIRTKHLNKRRKELTNETDNKSSMGNKNDNESESTPANATTNTQEVIPAWVNINNLGKFAEQMASSDINDIFQSVQAIRQLLSVPQKPPIEQVFASGVVPKLLQIICKKIDIKDRQNITPLEEKRIKLQFEASWQ